MTYHHTKAHSKQKIFSHKKYTTKLVSFWKIPTISNYNIGSKRPVGISADTLSPGLPALGSLYYGLSNCEDRFQKAPLYRSEKNYNFCLNGVPFSDNLYTIFIWFLKRPKFIGFRFLLHFWIAEIKTVPWISVLFL